MRAPRVRPGPVPSPRVPILVGGRGERKTFRLVARYAGASNIEGHGATGVSTREALAARFAVLRRHCDEVGRPYESVLRTYFRAGLLLAETQPKLDEKIERVLPPGFRAGGGSQLRGTPARATAALREYVAAGARYFNFFVADEDSLRRLAERVVPEFDGEARHQ